jgi:hypothetical protein
MRGEGSLFCGKSQGKHMKDERRTPSLPSQHAGYRDGEADSRHAADPRSPAYRLAFADHDFLTREELRPVRLQLELLKPQMIMDERGIESTVVMFGGARIPAPDTVDKAGTPELAALSRYYDRRGALPGS